MRSRRSLYIYRPIRRQGTVSLVTRDDAPDRLLWLNATSGVNAQGAAQFRASSQQLLQINSPDAALQPGTGDFWVAGWQRWDSTPAANMNLLRKYSPTSTASIAYQIFKQSNNIYRLRIDNSVGGFQIVDASTFGAIATNTWYFVFAYHDKSTGKIGISINGGTPNEAAFTGTPLNDSDRFTVGAVWNGSSHDSHHDGRIDQLAIGKGTDLDLAAIRAALYNGGTGVSVSGLSPSNRAAFGVTAFWELDEPSGTRRDSIGSNNLASITTATAANGVVEGPADDLDPVRGWADRIASIRFDAATVGNRPAYRTAGYLDFDGVDDSLGRTGALVGNRSAFTLLARIRLDTLPTANPAVVFTESDGAGNVANRLSIAPGGNVVASYRPSGGTLDSASSAGMLGAATDAVVAVRRDGTALQVFVNGQPSGPSATIGAGTDLVGASSRIGGPVESSGFAPLDGRVYDLFAVGRALSDAQIAGLSA